MTLRSVGPGLQSLLVLVLLQVVVASSLLRASDVFSPFSGPSAATRTRLSLPRLKYVDDFQTGSDLESLPTVEQLSKDCFTEQAFHASILVARLNTPSIELGELLTAQLSHRDGMRGFLAAYLAHESSEADKVPAPLTQAMKAVDLEQLAPLACMNVIRPSAMAAWHMDPVLQQNSSRMTLRAKRFLSSFRGSIYFEKNVQAIYAVASDSVRMDTQNNIEQFWLTVFRESRYDKAQRKAIAAAFASFIDE